MNMEVFDVCCADPLQPPLCLPRKNNYFEISDSAVVYPKYSQIFQMTHRRYGTNNALKHLIMKYENLGYNIPLAKPQYPHAPPPPQQWAPSQADRSELQTQHGIQAAWTRMTQLAAVHVRPSGGIWDIKSTIEKNK